MNRILLVVIAVILGCVVNMPQLKLKDSRMKVGAFAVGLYVALWFLNSQGLVEGKTQMPPMPAACKKYHDPVVRAYEREVKNRGILQGKYGILQKQYDKLRTKCSR